jgi:hypothetical protein
MTRCMRAGIALRESKKNLLLGYRALSFADLWNRGTVEQKCDGTEGRLGKGENADWLNGEKDKAIQSCGLVRVRHRYELSPFCWTCMRSLLAVVSKSHRPLHRSRSNCSWLQASKEGCGGLVTPPRRQVCGRRRELSCGDPQLTSSFGAD